MIVVFLAGVLVYGIISFLVSAIVWMFTSFVGIILAGLFLILLLGNLLAPPDTTKEEGDRD